MRKQEYIHVHALLVQITQYLVEHEDMPAETFERYEQLSTRPSSIHEAKENHHDAVMELSGDIEPWIDEEFSEAPTQPLEELP
jgi:hypothetical protein